VVRPRPLRIAGGRRGGAPGSTPLTHLRSLHDPGVVSISAAPTLVDAIQKAGGINIMGQTCSGCGVQRASARLPDSRSKGAPVWDLLAAGCATLNQLQGIHCSSMETRSSWMRLPRKELPKQFGQVGQSTILAPTQITVNVIGKWKFTPDGLQVPASTPLMQAILAGRWAWKPRRAKTSQLEKLVRINRNGRPCAAPISPLITTGSFPRPSNPPLVGWRHGDTSIAAAIAISAACGSGPSASPLSGIGNVWTCSACSTATLKLNAHHLGWLQRG